MNEALNIAIGVGISLFVIWVLLAVFLLLTRPRSASLSELLRLLPDSIQLLRRLIVDPEVPRTTRVRLWLLIAYLLSPFDLVPDFIPIIGHFDDVIMICVVLRSVVRHAGPEALRRNWRGSEEGLAALCRVAGLPSCNA